MNLKSDAKVRRKTARSKELQEFFSNLLRQKKHISTKGNQAQKICRIQ